MTLKDSLDYIKCVIHSLIPESKIFLFGSVLTDSFCSSSDIDIIIQNNNGEKIPFYLIGQLKEIFEDSNLFHTIDIVDYYRCSPEFIQINRQQMKELKE